MLWSLISIAFRELRRNILRSFLTSLGIIIGVASVITMVTLGHGATEKIKRQIESLGTNLLLIRPGQMFRSHGGVRGKAIPFTLADCSAIQREISGIEAVAPVAGETIHAIYGNKNWETTVTGSTDDFLVARDWPVSEGREFSISEVRAGKAVCIIGHTVFKELFRGEDPLGKVIRLGKQPFRVIGILASKGESPFGSDRDDIILIPIKAYHRRIAGNTDVTRIYVSVLNGEDVSFVKREIEKLMRQRRGIRRGEVDNFYVRDMKELASILSGTTSAMTSLLGIIAAVSLLVGGIGIMNIMLVAVTERVKEIGIRMAIGALPRDILIQFLIESVVLSCLGGVGGVVLALIMSAWLAKVLLVPLILDFKIICISFFFSALVGIFFGYFPARRAAALNPIEALRYE